jgi:hypothetical protein
MADVLTHFEATQGRVASNVINGLKKLYNVLMLFTPRKTSKPNHKSLKDLSTHQRTKNFFFIN